MASIFSQTNILLLIFLISLGVYIFFLYYSYKNETNAKIKTKLEKVQYSAVIIFLIIFAIFSANVKNEYDKISSEQPKINPAKNLFLRMHNR